MEILAAIGALLLALLLFFLVVAVVLALAGRFKLTNNRDEDGWMIFKLTYTSRSRDNNTQEDGS
jgi:hypothetical protein